MADVLSSIFTAFKREFPKKLQALLLDQKLHLTNREALRCFLLGMLVNIFRHPAVSNHLEKSYLTTTTSDLIFWFVVTKAETTGKKQEPRMKMFVFDSSGEWRKPKLAPRTRDNLIALLIADQYGRLLSDKKFPKAKIVSIYGTGSHYKVNVCPIFIGIMS